MTWEVCCTTISVKTAYSLSFINPGDSAKEEEKNRIKTIGAINLIRGKNEKDWGIGDRKGNISDH